HLPGTRRRQVGHAQGGAARRQGSALENVGAAPYPHADGHGRRDGVPARQDEGFEDQRGLLRNDEPVAGRGVKFSLTDVFTAGGLATLASVILIDLTMAGDNVVIMGTIASGLPARERQRVLLLGVTFALVFLIGFALTATWLLHFTGLLLAGGLLLLWVAF